MLSFIIIVFLVIIAIFFIASSSNSKKETSESQVYKADFYLRNADIIKPLENKIHLPYDSSASVESQIATCKNALSAFDELQQYCYKSNEGIAYFQNMWEHCHNSQNADFSFRVKIEEKLDYLLKNKDDLRYRENKLPSLRNELIEYISSHTDVIQKNIYSNFNPILKNDIQHELYLMDKEHIIQRTKYKNSYILKLLN